ncbi:hypothetical protein [Lacticaseibacillus kribbianus]|uniref:hypothetical protein n=1 Tax=Lacticaseibacillus kribbianus TaxID=2926292 RepID=UPI001CD7D49C|nr:hypothetical protein [Lacticaseibacillus kribbianus]
MLRRYITPLLKFATAVLAVLAAVWMALNVVMPLTTRHFGDLSATWRVITVAGIAMIVLLILEASAVSRPPRPLWAAALAALTMLATGVCWALFTVAHAIYWLALAASVLFVTTACAVRHED